MIVENYDDNCIDNSFEINNIKGNGSYYICYVVLIYYIFFLWII